PRDMLRISDARMSGTSYGACVLHAAPESSIGGPLALLRNGDTVRLDLPARRLDMLVDEAELERRRAEWVAPEPRFERGWGWMFSKHVTQADKGCDFDFLERGFGRAAGEPDIY
ncbi:MAG: dihydroxy-acid dehydratase, partial [Pannonibacter indicus]